SLHRLLDNPRFLFFGAELKEPFKAVVNAYTPKGPMMDLLELTQGKSGDPGVVAQTNPLLPIEYPRLCHATLLVDQDLFENLAGLVLVAVLAIGSLKNFEPGVVGGYDDVCRSFTKALDLLSSLIAAR